MKILKNEKICWRYPHFTRVPKITIIWCTVQCLEIFSFYTYICTIKEDHERSCFLKYIRCDRQKFLSFCFCPFSPLTTWKIKILKLTKTPGDIIILNISTINGSHMMYSSWDMECNGRNFLWFWTIFCPFTPFY